MSTAALSAKKALIKETLAQDSIAEAIKSLKQWLPQGSKRYEDLLLIEARQNDTNRKRLRNVVTDQELQIAYNKIREDLLDLIDSLQLADFDTSVPDSKLTDSKKAKRGHILHRIPNRMQHLQETRCVVRIALDEETIIENIDLDEHVQLKPVRVSDLMQVELMDPAEEAAFAIRTINTPEQFIDEDDYTEWQFFVKPLKTGTYPLMLKVAVIELIYGKERKREIVLEQAIDIVTTQPQEEAGSSFQSAGYTLDFSDTVALKDFHVPAAPTARSAPEYRIPREEAAPSPGMRSFRGSAARRVALSLALLLAFLGGTWAVSPGEVEWVATRYLFNTAAAYERFIERHEDSRHVEQALWRKAEIVDESEVYQEYLTAYPTAAVARANGWTLPELQQIIDSTAVDPLNEDSLSDKRPTSLQLPKAENRNEDKLTKPPVKSKPSKTDVDIPTDQINAADKGKITDTAKRAFLNPFVESEPALSGKSACSPRIIEVYLGPDQTRVNLRFERCNVGIYGPDDAQNAFFLRTNKTTVFQLLKIEGILPSASTPVDSGQVVELFFEPLPVATRQFDMIEGEVQNMETRTYWNFLGIDLTSNSSEKSEPAIDPQPSAPGDDTSDPKSTGLPMKEPVFDGNYGAVEDPQGHTYRTLPLNGLTWTADNLNLEIADSWCYEDDLEICATYGRLYTWEAAKKACNTLGPGWRLPTDQDWSDMVKLFGGADDDAQDGGEAAYRALMEGGSSGFSAQLGGTRNSNGSFDYLESRGLFWSATEDGTGLVLSYFFYRGHDKLYRFGGTKSAGFFCRCVQE